MTRKVFCLPADYKTSSVKIIQELLEESSADTGCELYGSISAFGFGSGRKNSSLPNCSKSMFLKYVSYAKSFGIDFFYTLNASTLGNIEYTNVGRERIFHFLSELDNMGVKGLIVSIPPLIEIIKRNFPNLVIVASAVSKIDSVSKVTEYLSLGAERVVLFEDSTRNFKLLERLEKLKVGVEIIVNQDCLYGCISRDYHRNCSALFRSDENTYDIDQWMPRCKVRRLKEPVNFIKTPTMIRPDDIEYYASAGVKYFKIVGRELYNTNILDIFRHYLHVTKEMNLFDLIAQSGLQETPLFLNSLHMDGFLEHFVQNKNLCFTSCEECGYCEKFAVNIQSKVSNSSISHLEGSIDRFINGDALSLVESTLPMFNFINNDNGEDLNYSQFQDAILKKYHFINKQTISSINELTQIKYKNYNNSYLQISIDETIDDISSILNPLKNLAISGSVSELGVTLNVDSLSNADFLLLRKSPLLSFMMLSFSFGTLKRIHMNSSQNLLALSRVEFTLDDDMDLEDLLSPLIALGSSVFIKVPKEMLLEKISRDQLLPKLEIIGRLLLSKGMSSFDSNVAIPFHQYLHGNSISTSSPLWADEIDNCDDLIELFSQCKKCTLLPLCVGHYLSPYISQEEQKEICGTIKMIFKMQKKYYRICRDGNQRNSNEKG